MIQISYFSRKMVWKRRKIHPFRNGSSLGKDSFILHSYINSSVYILHFIYTNWKICCWCLLFCSRLDDPKRKIIWKKEKSLNFHQLFLHVIATHSILSRKRVNKIFHFVAYTNILIEQYAYNGSTVYKAFDRVCGV